MGTLVYMATKVRHDLSTVAVASPAGCGPRERVPEEAYAGIDFEALNRRVADYRNVGREHGFDAALSLYAGEPLVARVDQS